MDFPRDTPNDVDPTTNGPVLQGMYILAGITFIASLALWTGLRRQDRSPTPAAGRRG